MPNTEESIQENGIPEISFTMQANTTIPQAVDDTLTIEDEAADAKATGDAIRALEGDIGALNATTLYMDGETRTPANTIAAVIAALFPIGSMYITTGSAQPPAVLDFTWTEILMPITWGDAANGSRSWTAGTGSGTVHYWRRTA